MATFVLDPEVDLTATVPRLSRPFQRRLYKDKQFQGSDSDYKKKIEASTTIYVGNLSCYTTEYQLYELFTRFGTIKRIIMGLDKFKKTPCGFCFVEFDDRESALLSVKLINKTHLDGREINVDIDYGFEEGRQFGRGAHGGQISDERRRESGGATTHRNITGGSAATNVLTRSITIVTCVAIVSALLLVSQPDPVHSDVIIRPYSRFVTNRTGYLNAAYIRQAQLGQGRDAFERSFAQFLVNLLKSAKPTLLEAFIKATLADKQLKATAIKLFFNNTEDDSGDSSTSD